jgi:hypothetical protein
MKKIAGIVLLILVLGACQPVADYKSVRDDVIKVHDVVMADHGIIIGNQVRLDALLKDLKQLKKRFPALDTLKEQKEINALKSDLLSAEELMNDWMHQFEPDITGKSNEAAIRYFEAEKMKIADIDSLYKQKIKLSDSYLVRFK